MSLRFCKCQFSNVYTSVSGARDAPVKSVRPTSRI